MDIKGYRIEKVIGRGGMATVYLAVQTTLERHVALKVMNPAFANDHEFTTRFLQEGPIAARLNDPQIVTVYDSGVDQNHYYLAMEYLPGGTLKQKIREGLPVDKTLNIIKLLAKGLAYAHSQGVLHRDIKPQNILFRASGEPVLTDFGIAKALTGSSNLTVPGTAFGSPKYMSPEQAKGAALDHRADLYSLGVVFYEMLTGHSLFASKDAITLVQKHIKEPPPPLPAKHALFQPLFDRLLAKDPANRFQTADEFLAALKDVRQQYFIDVSLGGTQPNLDVTQVRIPNQSVSTGQHTQPPPAARSGLPKLLVGLVVLVAALVGGGYIYLFYSANKTPPVIAQPQPPADTQTDAVATALATARQQQQQGQLEQGLQTVRNALRKTPDQPQLLLLETELQTALSAAQPATPTAADIIAQAQQLRQQGQLEQSLTLVQNALAQQPQNDDLRNLQQELQATIADLEQRSQVASLIATAQKGLQQNNLNASRAAIEQGLAIRPGDTELLALQRQVNARQAALDRDQKIASLYQQAEQQLQQKQLDAALETTQQGLALAPQNERLTALRDLILASQQQAAVEQQLREQMEQLLAQAQTQLDQLQLTTPPGSNAYETYQQVLAQEPENGAALAGLRAIAGKYFELAERALATGDEDKTLGYIERGLNVQPADPNLLALQRQIQLQQDARQQLALARQQLAQDQVENSLNTVESGLEAVPDDADLLALRDEILQRLDQREKQLIATTALAEARELRQQNQLQEAMTVLSRALREAPDNSEVAAFYTQLEQEQAQLQQQAAAAESLATAQALLDRSEFTDAYQQVQQGLQQSPDDSALLALKKEIEQRQALLTLRTKAEELAQQGALEDALSLVQRGLAMSSDEPQLLALQTQLEQTLQSRQETAATDDTVTVAASTEQASTEQASTEQASTEQASTEQASTEQALPDVLKLGTGLATLAQQIGLENVEGFLRERVDNLAQSTAAQSTDTPDSGTATDDPPPGDTDIANASDGDSTRNIADSSTADTNDLGSTDSQTTPTEDTTASDSTAPATTTETAEYPFDNTEENPFDTDLYGNTQISTAPAVESPAVDTPTTSDPASDEPAADPDTAAGEPAADDAQATDTTEAQVAELLATAEKHLAKLNLTTPKGNNAYDVFREVLKLDPDNSAARKGLQTIVNRYRSWAISQRDQGKFSRSLNNIDKALRVDPDNRELLALRQTVQDQQAAAEAARRASAQQAQQPAPETDPCAIDKGSKECWCKTLKMFCD